MASKALKEFWDMRLEKRRKTLEEDINRELSEILRKEIDREILEKVQEQQRKEQGWYRVPGWDTEYPVIPRSQETRDWLETNCQGGYLQLYGRVLFERQDDAVMFSLAWA